MRLLASICSESVSYTHLDVYKRQVMENGVLKFLKTAEKLCREVRVSVYFQNREEYNLIFPGVAYFHVIII